MIKVYAYEKCSTCKKALKFLRDKKIAHEAIAIDLKPPTKTELKQMLKHTGELKKIFNTSGKIYREQKLSTKLPDMTNEQAIDMLANEGKLIKRPFVVGKGINLVGFREEEWKKAIDQVTS